MLLTHFQPCKSKGAKHQPWRKEQSFFFVNWYNILCRTRYLKPPMRLNVNTAVVCPVPKSVEPTWPPLTPGKTVWHGRGQYPLLPTILTGIGAFDSWLPSSETSVFKTFESAVFTEKVGGRKRLERSGVCVNQFLERSETINSSACAKLEKSNSGLKNHSHLL